jgi:hypothetical protein
MSRASRRTWLGAVRTFEEMGHADADQIRIRMACPDPQRAILLRLRDGSPINQIEAQNRLRGA